tara:strand:+ start:1920 stop:2483 length:564 start_codon:yes stop_codon:yes gene_type:complete
MDNYQIISIDKLNNFSILECINRLPRDIQKRIYIFYWKHFWKEYIPLTAKPPSWLKYHNYVQDTLWNARLKNIHFSHLPFNTLPENKKWIMGCQCDFCINDKVICPVEKHMHYLIQYRNSYYFPENFMPKSFTEWNEYLMPIGNNYISDNIEFNKVFDPLCGSYKENYNSKRLREGGTFEFSYPLHE